MPKFLLLMILFVGQMVFAAPTTTTNYQFWKPSDGDNQWGELIRDNWDKADTQIFGLNTTITNHINATSNAHPASAISTTGGPNVCEIFFTVEDYLDCLDNAIFGNLGGTSLVTLSDDQTISGVKTFTSTQIFSTPPQLSTITDSILVTDASGIIGGSSFDALDPLTTKGELLTHDGTATTVQTVGPDGAFLRADSTTANGISWQEPDIQWLKFEVTFSDLSASALTSSVVAFNLQAAQTIEGVIIRPTQEFTGGAITGYTLKMGYGAQSDRVASEFSVFLPPTGATSQVTNILDVPSFDAVTQIQLFATSTGANLSEATQGAATIYLKVSTLP